MLEGVMQNDFPLTLQHIQRRMLLCSPDAEVVTLIAPGVIERASFSEVGERTDRLARALGRLGVKQGDRVATFAWNNQRHFELYFAVPCVGAVLHTLNIRLFEEQITYIVNHAEDKVIFIDDSLVPLLEELAPSFRHVEHYVVMGDGDAGSLPGALRYEELLQEAGPGEFEYPAVEERQAAALCYTSGTTGNPKGVLYSHRSTALHSTVVMGPDANLLSSRDRVLAVVPMFHVNAWGLPFAAAMAGADLIMPNRYLQSEPLAGLIVSERPTMMAGVPTIFSDLLRYADEHHPDLSSLVNCICGGSAAPMKLLRDFRSRVRPRTSSRRSIGACGPRRDARSRGWSCVWSMTMARRYPGMASRRERSRCAVPGWPRATTTIPRAMRSSATGGCARATSARWIAAGTCA
jgi:fatty-acyl-CoA synthase